MMFGGKSKTMRKPMDEDEEDLEGSSESDPEAENSAIDMLLVGSPKESSETAEDPQALLDDIEGSMAQLRKLVDRMG